MKFMIAGLGSIGHRHLRHLLALGQEDILLYRSHKGNMEGDEFSHFPVEINLEKALAYKPDAVIISNPTAHHLDVAIPAARAGCDILIEKPLSHDLERIDEFKSVVDESGVKVLVGFQFRHHPSLQKIKEILAAEEIGRPISFRAHWGEYLPDWHPWEDYRKGYSARKDLGGGVVLTLSHPLDYLRMIFGEISDVAAFTEKQSDLEIDVEDSAEILLRFEERIIGSVHLNYTQRPPRHTLEIVCTKGTIRFDQAKDGLEVYSADKEGWHTYKLPENFERDDLFRAQMKHFIDVLDGKVAPICTMEDGIKLQEIVMKVLSIGIEPLSIEVNKKRE